MHPQTPPLNPASPGPQGVVGEACADKYNISREQQDQFAIGSYTKSQNSEQYFKQQITPITISSRKGFLSPTRLHHLSFDNHLRVDRHLWADQ